MVTAVSIKHVKSSNQGGSRLQTSVDSMISPSNSDNKVKSDEDDDIVDAYDSNATAPTDEKS